MLHGVGEMFGGGPAEDPDGLRSILWDPAARVTAAPTVEDPFHNGGLAARVTWKVGAQIWDYCLEFHDKEKRT